LRKITTARTRNNKVDTLNPPSIAVLSSKSLKLLHVSRPARADQTCPAPLPQGRAKLAAAAGQILKHCKAQANPAWLCLFCRRR
jgi:hypothetical protein